MDESAEIPPALIAYKDRSTGLIVFGILTILLGGVAALFVLLLLFALLVPAHSGGPQVQLNGLLPAMGLYGIMAVALVWMGIGSIRARRWARNLLLIFSWSWLAVGVLTMAAMAILMPRIFGSLPVTPGSDRPALSGGALDGVLLVIFLVDGIFFILLPAIWTFFYQSRHVRATCEARDSAPGWTDACPAPVLGLSLWLACSCFSLLLMPFVGHGVVPFFGIFLTGIAGTILYLVLAGLWGYAAWALYHLDVHGWWVILLALGLYLISSILTFARHSVLEMYQLMGYPPEQIEQIRSSGFLTGNGMIWITVVSSAVLLGYLLFVKKYFPERA